MSPAFPSPDLRQIGGRALLEVLDTLLSLPATAAARGDEVSAGVTGRHLLATVALTGERVSGDVQFQSEAFAGQAAGLLLGGNGASPVDNTQINDFTGELCNMIAGRVAACLGQEGYPCSLDTPKVVGGNRLLLEPESETAPGRTDWSCQGHRLTLEIQCRYRPT